MVVKLWAEGSGNSVGASLLAFIVEGELDGDICVHSYIGKIIQTLLLFSHKSKSEREENRFKVIEVPSNLD